MRTIDEEAQLILSDPASSEQLRRVADAALERGSLLKVWEQEDVHDDCISQDELSEAQSALEDAEAEVQKLKRDLEADRRHSAKIRELLSEAADLLGNSHNTHAVEWRAKYLALGRE